ncbi:hypothetical protein HF086_015860 [Spodoptera exigua]|uniref:Regulatory protein zeste n=2 Tax=Spodoptera exigua TaxID=7107 RepID=A0A922M3N5_SPOEX|nr:hypothetical protein HF086_015860 [Spodoptera exigua]
MENRVHKKRQRSENWFEQDKILLTELVKEKVSDIENKNTDTNTNTKKQAAWGDLQSSFNSMCTGGKRTISQLKSQWGIIKMNTKRMKMEGRKQIIAEGGDTLPLEGPNKDDVTKLPFDFMLEKTKTNHDDNHQVKPKLAERSSSTDSIRLVINEDEIMIEDIPCSTQKEDMKEEVLNKKQNGNETSNTCSTNITNLEMKCRKELHAIQMENEKRKSRNLDLEEELLRGKIDYYKKKSRSLLA